MLATHASQIDTLATEQLALTMQTQNLWSSLNGVSAQIKTTWTTSVTPAEALAAMQMTVAADGRAAGLHVVSTSSGAYIALDADKAMFRSSSGSQFALFDSYGGALYLKGSLFASGSITSAHLATGSVTTDKLTIGNVTTDRVAWAAINNVIADKKTDTVNRVDLLVVPIVRTPGTKCLIRAQFYLGRIDGTFSLGWGPSSNISRMIVIRRHYGSGFIDVFKMPYTVQTIEFFLYNNIYYYKYGDCFVNFDFLDTDYLDGLVAYEVLFPDGNMGWGPWGGGIGQRSMVVQEIKR